MLARFSHKSAKISDFSVRGRKLRAFLVTKSDLFGSRARESILPFFCVGSEGDFIRASRENAEKSLGRFGGQMAKFVEPPRWHAKRDFSAFLADFAVSFLELGANICVGSKGDFATQKRREVNIYFTRAKAR